MFYLVTVRAVALEVRAHNTTYLLVMLLFFAAVIEFGVIVGGDLPCQPDSSRYLIPLFIFSEFMARFGYFSYTDTNCQLLTFAIYGNRILQVNNMIVLFPADPGCPGCRCPRR